jgi:hypothetical protein
MISSESIRLPSPSLGVFSRIEKGPDRLSQISIESPDGFEGHVHETVLSRLLHQLGHVAFATYRYYHEQPSFSIYLHNFANGRCSSGYGISLDNNA